MKTCLDRVRLLKPLVHCITNYVTVADCARIVAALGASPIMADAPEEVAEIQSIAHALCVNIGTLNPQMVTGMLHAANIAWQNGHPAVLDPVGVGASRLRSTAAATLTMSKRFTLVRGNMSEIRALGQIATKPRGTDVATEDQITENNLKDAVEIASRLSRRWNAVVGISGPIDIIAAPDGRCATVTNGHEIMPRLTGTGCMLSALCAAFLGANPTAPFEATLTAFCTMGVAGEIAASELKSGEGTAMWHLRFLDVIARLTGDELEQMARYSKFDCPEAS